MSEALMRTWVVARPSSEVEAETVEAERCWHDEGSLIFANKPEDSEFYVMVAVYAPGSWKHVNLVVPARIEGG